MTPPRSVPDWDSFYIGLLYQYSGRSKDPNSQTGAAVIDANNVPLGFGMNGIPRAINDKEIDWSRPDPKNPDDLGKYPYIKHAEENAIRHSRAISINGLEGCTMYVTGHPCMRCMLEIADKGIKRVVWGPLALKMVDKNHFRYGEDIAKRAGIVVEKFTGSLLWVKERVNWMEEKGLFEKDIWTPK
jgi:dCMP deaminase